MWEKNNKINLWKRFVKTKAENDKMRNQETTEIRSKAKNYLSNLREFILKNKELGNLAMSNEENKKISSQNKY